MIDPRYIQAIIHVESGSLPPVGPRGPVIRLELHHLLDRAQGAVREALAERFRTPPKNRWLNHEWRPTPDAAWTRLHTGQQDSEYDAFDEARRITNAHGVGMIPYYAISVGKAQIMGRHHLRVGYDTPAAMWSAAFDEANQDLQLQRFLESDPKIVKALAAGDLFTAIGIYNTGIGSAHRMSDAQRRQVNAYVAKVQAALDRMST